MNPIQTQAYAKLNLTLDITGRRADGYHELDMVMVSCTLHDTITLHLDTHQPWQLRCQNAALPSGPDNLAWRAAEAFFSATAAACTGLTICLEKQIPSGAGLGGGSSDAAAVLHALNCAYGGPLRLQELCEIGLKLGADVPYCLVAGAQRAQGIGERLTPLPPLPDCWIVLCKPRVCFSTPALFQAVDALRCLPHPDAGAMAHALAAKDLGQIGLLLGNSFLPAALERAPELSGLLAQIRACGCLGATMTGSGSCIYGLFDSRQKAARCCDQLSGSGSQIFLARPK